MTTPRHQSFPIFKLIELLDVKNSRMRGAAMVAGMLAAGTLSAVEELPSAAIPPATRPVVVDGKITPGEWSDAAVLRRIFRKGNRAPGAQPTDFYVKYTPDSLYVAAVCHESTPGYPEAYARPWNDLLFRNDDAVQIVLGVTDRNVAVQGKIDVGGYEGALDGKTAAADFYYMYTVNAAGSRQRAFNEAPLEQPEFAAAVGKTPGKNWVAEIRIPFSSCGLGKMTGKNVFANLFRFRPPEMTGWNYRGFWGYAAMPFGKFSFLPPGKEPLKTVEKAPPPQAPAAKRCQAELQYSPLCGRYIGKATLSGSWEPLYGILKVSGLPTVKKPLNGGAALVDHDAVKLKNGSRLAAVMAEVKPGSQPERQASFEVVDAKGKVIARVDRKCPAVTAPEWLGTDNGIEWVDQRFPAPWTVPTAAAKTVTLLDKTVTFNRFSLPSSIVFKDTKAELLAGDAILEIRSGGRPLTFQGQAGPVVIDRTRSRTASRLSSGNTVLETKSYMEADGFMAVKFRLKSPAPEKIDRVSLKIPLRKNRAEFLMHGILVQKIGRLTGAGFRDEAAPFWLGTYDRGLSFNYDTELFHSADQRHQIEVRQDADATWLIFNFCDGRGQVSADTVFRFFLQPTPTKPMPSRRIGEHVQRKWENWSEWHGYPDLSKIPELKKWTAELKKQDQIGILYTCQGLQVNAPGFREFRSDLELQPSWRYYRNKGQDCFAISKRGPEGDLQLWGWKKLIHEGGIRGFISDGMIPAWGDSNPAHWQFDGLDRNVSMDRDMTSRVVAQRNFIKRMRGMFTATGEPFCIMAHTGGGIDINTMSFIDGYMEGEQMLRYKRGYYLPPDIYAIGYSGLPWGWRSIFWAKRWRNYQGIDRSLAYAMLFNTELNGNAEVENPLYSLELYRDFQPAQSRFYPFWQPMPGMQLESGHSLASLYVADGKAMAVISNLSYRPDEYRLKLPELFPGRKVSVREILSDRIPAGTGRGEIRGRLEPHSCDIIRIDATDSVPPITVTPAVAAPARADRFTIDRYRPGDWKINTEQKNVTADVAFKLPDGRTGLSLNAAPGRSHAFATLIHPFGRNADIDLSVKLPRRFKIKFGPVTIGYGGGFTGYGWNLSGPVAKRGNGEVIRQIPLAENRWVPLRISLRHGVLNVLYNHMPIIRDLPLDLPATGNRLALQTWWKDSLQFTVNEISTTPKEIIVSETTHPVIP